MEPAPKSVVYAYYPKIVRVYEHFEEIWVSGSGSNTIRRRESQGWYIQLEGFGESIYLGSEEPTLKAGDRVKITIRKVM